MPCLCSIPIPPFPLRGKGETGKGRRSKKQKRRKRRGFLFPVNIVQSVEHLYVAQSVPCSSQGIHPIIFVQSLINSLLRIFI